MAFSIGGPANYNPAMLGGVTTQPVGRPAPGPAGLGGNQQTKDFLAWAATPAGQQWGQQQRQLSLGGNNAPGNPGFGIGANGGVAWVGQGPEPTGAARDAGIAAFLRGTLGEKDANGNPAGAAWDKLRGATAGVGGTPGVLGSAMPGYSGPGATPGSTPGTVPGTTPGTVPGAPGSTGGSQYPSGQFPAPGTPGAPTVPDSTTLPQIPTGESGFMTTNPTTHSAVPQYGLVGAEDAMRRGLEGGISGIETGINQAGNTLSPYTGSGAKSSNLQAALSGALGPEAQRQAFANYNESPEVAYQREMGEKAIMRNAAAMGGLGGSRVQQELQRHAIGLAQQDYGNAFNRLGSLSALGQNSANLLGGLQANAGGKVGDYAFGTGQAMASGRTRAGEQIANNVQGTSASLADMMARQGTDLSGVIGQGGNNIAQLLAQYGVTDAETQQKLAAILANIATQNASTVAATTQLPEINDGSKLEDIGKLFSAISGK